ncbi:MAG: hypothetical protein JSU70_09395 [Phycisphaerales bacterium]|nr:MAG: hypothetical protein JSU70_09395 [Phycisphaerales bacterium]
MKNNVALVTCVVCFVLLPLTFYAGCEEPATTGEVDKLVSPSFEIGKKAAQDYIANAVSDYELVLELHELDAGGREHFLRGFAAAFGEAGRDREGTRYRSVLEESVRGSQFTTGRETGSKHAQKSTTNAQVQGLIQNSLGVSSGVALGWKAGYIKGFAAQRVTETAAGGVVSEEAVQGLYREAAATYNAVRSAIGQ